MRNIRFCKRWTPPKFFRHVVSWKLLRLIDNYANTCWVGMVMWKLGYDGWCWWPHRNCFENGDYCGKFTDKPMPRICESPTIAFIENKKS